LEPVVQTAPSKNTSTLEMKKNASFAILRVMVPGALTVQIANIGMGAVPINAVGVDQLPLVADVRIVHLNITRNRDN
jgi:alanine dehydrogenase